MQYDVSASASKYLVYIGVALFGFAFGLASVILPYKLTEQGSTIETLRTQVSEEEREAGVEVYARVLGESISAEGDFDLRAENEGGYGLYYMSGNKASLLGYDLTITALTGKVSQVSCMDEMDCIMKDIKGDNISVLALTPVEGTVAIDGQTPIVELSSADDLLVLKIEQGSEIGYMDGQIQSLSEDLVIAATK